MSFVIFFFWVLGEFLLMVNFGKGGKDESVFNWGMDSFDSDMYIWFFLYMGIFCNGLK